MKKRFVTSALMVGVLALAALMQTAPAQAQARGSGQGQGGGGGQGGIQSPSQGQGQGQSPSQGQGQGQGQSPSQGQGQGQGGSTGGIVPPAIAACSTSDVLLGGNAASDCFRQAVGNDVRSSPTLFDLLRNGQNPLSQGYGNQWLRAGAEIQNGIGSALGFSAGTFTSAATTGKTGTWSLSLTNAAIQALVISVKGGNGWSAYLFDPVNLASPSGTWTTAGLLNDGDNQPDLSHISAYYVASPTPVPTPALVPAAIGAGLALLRKKKQEEKATQDV